MYSRCAPCVGGESEASVTSSGSRTGRGVASGRREAVPMPVRAGAKVAGGLPWLGTATGDADGPRPRPRCPVWPGESESAATGLAVGRPRPLRGRHGIGGHAGDPGAGGVRLRGSAAADAAGGRPEPARGAGRGVHQLAQRQVEREHDR